MKGDRRAGSFDRIALTYDAWYETPLGQLVDRLEKEAVFALIEQGPGHLALDLSCGTGNYDKEGRRRKRRGMRQRWMWGVILVFAGAGGLAFMEGVGGMPGLWSHGIGSGGYASNGEQIYSTGISGRGGPIPFRGGPMWMGMHGGGCANCHGVHGRGGVPVMMSGKIPTDIRYLRLTEKGHGEHSKEGHPPYTDDLVKRAVREGIDPAGRPLDWTMPRWAIDDEDFADLLTYLKGLE